LARSGGSKQWHIGIQDPRDKTKILNKLSIGSGAVATSGSYERGAHIINPKTGQPADELLSVSVIGPDIIKADVLATAAFAMGARGLDFIRLQDGYEALVINKNDKLFRTDKIIVPEIIKL
jgi:thiamine biosynthesis lipoprotein